MAKIKLTKTAADAATFGAKEYELRDTVVPGFLLKVTPTGRKIFMIQYRTNAGERRSQACLKKKFLPTPFFCAPQQSPQDARLTNL